MRLLARGCVSFGFVGFGDLIFLPWQSCLVGGVVSDADLRIWVNVFFFIWLGCLFLEKKDSSDIPSDGKEFVSDCFLLGW